MVEIIPEKLKVKSQAYIKTGRTRKMGHEWVITGKERHEPTFEWTLRD